MKMRRSEWVLLAMTALFLAAMAVLAYLPTRTEPATLVKTEISAPAEELLIPAQGGEAADAVGLININTAGEDTLTHLPGIGPELARRIILWRSQHGPFDAPEDIMQVSGIGERTYEAMAGLITCQEETE